MSGLTRTYTGFAPRGRQKLPARSVAFERGVPIEVDADEAAALDAEGGWEAPKTNPKPKASEAEPKES